MKSKKILFLTGTRADYGKIKSLLKAIEHDASFELYIYVTGMHLQEQFGATYNEVIKDKYENIHVAFGSNYTNNMSFNLGNVICNFTGYVESIKPDLIVVHGDRIEALAGACVGALNNIRVAHIEGGEISGTIDESIRYAISKLSHFHFVSNVEAKIRLEQLGENKDTIYIIGSPDIDIMCADDLPRLDFVKKYYEINFSEYAIMMYHPVTTEYEFIAEKARIVVEAAIDSGRNFIVIYPNNDLGSELILDSYQKIKGNSKFKIFPSLRFEYFLVLLKNSLFVYGNSSAGIRETAIYGIPTIDIGTRQLGRYDSSILKNIQHVNEDKKSLIKAIERSSEYHHKSNIWGMGNSQELFMNVIENEKFWNMTLQKKFFDLKGCL